MNIRTVSAAIAMGTALLGILAPASADAALPVAGSASTHAVAMASSTVFRLNAGQSADVPTWFWGTTTVCGFNLTGTATTLKLASRSGAAPEYIRIYGYGNSCIREAWWGVPLQVTDVGASPIQVTAS
jgi:hypothetical protein